MTPFFLGLLRPLEEISFTHSKIYVSVVVVVVVFNCLLEEREWIRVVKVIRRGHLEVELLLVETNVAKRGFVLYFFCQFQLVSGWPIPRNEASWNMSK